MTSSIERQYPFVSVLMPIRDEARYIERSLAAILAQDYPASRMEVLIIDGMSRDGTREIARATIESHPGCAVRLLDNPGRSAPAALNIGLRHARGEVVIRVDGHCVIARAYLRRCVEALQATGATCAGGPITTVGETSVAQAIAAAQSSRFGVGGAAFRTGPERGKYVDTLAFGAYRREIFERIGGFDEELTRNQDDEFNFRLIQAGGTIWLDPAIRSIYYSRASLGRLWRQYFEYGLYKVRVIQKRGGVASWRHLAPPAFVLALLAAFALALVAARPALALLIVGPYLGANLSASLMLARQQGARAALVPLAFASLHLSYGAGFLYGLWRWRKQRFAKRISTP